MRKIAWLGLLGLLCLLCFEGTSAVANSLDVDEGMLISEEGEIPVYRRDAKNDFTLTNMTLPIGGLLQIDPSVIGAAAVPGADLDLTIIMHRFKKDLFISSARLAKFRAFGGKMVFLEKPSKRGKVMDKLNTKKNEFAAFSYTAIVYNRGEKALYAKISLTEGGPVGWLLIEPNKDLRISEDPLRVSDYIRGLIPVNP